MDSKIYAAQYINYDEEHSAIISLHRTREGAEKANADHRAARIRGIEQVLGLGEMDSDRVAYCLKDEGWRVEELEVQE